MDLLPPPTDAPAGAGGSGRGLRRGVGFRSLKLVSVSMDEPLPVDPVGATYGRLANGLTYYVRSNPKPRMRAALSLAVKVGSVVEEEDERGVAHIVEHLAFSATSRYTNHDIIKFLESIGAEFGACQNALTSSDETIYELLVPVDKPGLLSQAICVLAEFSSEVRVSAEDLEKERGAVLEEYRGGRNATGRMQDSHWALLFEGSKKWYHLSNMAVFAVGDFPDTQEHFGQKAPAPIPSPVIPEFPVPSHEEPRFSCFVESEAAGVAVVISCKMPAGEIKTVKDYKDSLAESMFHCALNQRLFKISRGKDPPYFSCSSAADALVRPVKAYIMTSSCRERGTVEALESMLLELLSTLITFVFFLQHFLREEPVVGIEYEAQLQKTLLPHISSTEVAKFAENFSTASSCVIKIVEPRAHASLEDLKAVVLKINSLEEEKSIPPWDEEQIPEEIVAEAPEPGSIIDKVEHPGIGATEMTLSNGMRICYKYTDFLDDQVVFTGFAYGGLSELSEAEYTSCSMGSTIAGEIGTFGYRPSVLMDMLAGKRAEVGTKVGAYMRTFSGDCSPSDLETALQLVYQLFTTNVEPREEEVKIVMQMAEEAIYAQERDPYTAFANRVREINYGNSYFFKGGIPRVQNAAQPLNRDDLRGLPFKFPATIIREVVRSPMVEAQCFVQLAFPVVLKSTMMTEDIHYVGFLSKLLETKIMQVLRFKYGQIYSVNVAVFLGGNKPSRTGDVRGDISVNFSCDPDISSKLVDFVLEEISYLQAEGPSEEDVLTILEIEQRAHENGLQENYFWLDRILRSYQSRLFSGDIGSTFAFQEEGRMKVREALTPQTMQSALQRVIPFPCRNQYTVVILMPKPSCWASVKSMLSWSSNGVSRDAKVRIEPFIYFQRLALFSLVVKKSASCILSLRPTYLQILAGMAGALVLAVSLWRYSRSALKS
ncbi:Zinc protease PQQL-like [Dichanthelium oligosanthes]|uniref:Zinc protease PQQL-like n=1 Tax=Dichanthelium oligosanthes TaxID=888268 RepID=A0A1E5V9L0_9POAL|nr:Zinc protease PQQL-like [Dichanthelium oligosanthes]